MGWLAAVYDWLDERAAIRSLVRKGLYEAVPVRGAWFYTLGSATLVLILLQLVTGIFLTLLYVPSVTEAWASLNYLKQHDAFGSIVRGIHLWSAYILLFVIGLHMVRTFFSGSYKRPRELNWVTGVGLFVLVLGMAITGAFLPWDQAAYWTAVVVTNIPAYTPFIGSFIRALWRGGDFVGPITLSRTFGIHVWLIPAILFPLIGAHLALLRKHGEFGSYINYRGAYRSREGVDVPPPPAQRPIEPPYPAVPTDELWAAPLETEDFFPFQTFKDGLISVALVIVVFVLAVAIGAPLEAVAGFLAAVFMRGIPVVQVPTTVVAQLDASIGGKTGVNLRAGKNLVGAFHQPKAVIVDPDILATLDEREFRSGLFEALKCGVIRDGDLFAEM